tara:strand:+ start:929 stop:1255 length:327 start_codon:yes stop_codon:yes gene_type:complete
MTTFVILLISIGLICNSFIIGNIVGHAQGNIDKDKQQPHIYIERVHIVQNNKESDSVRLNSVSDVILDAEYEEVGQSTTLLNPRLAKALRAYKSCLDKQEPPKWSRYM